MILKRLNNFYAKKKKSNMLNGCGSEQLARATFVNQVHNCVASGPKENSTIDLDMLP